MVKAGGKESTCCAGDRGLIPGSGRSPGREKCNPLQHSFLKNPSDREEPTGCSPKGHKESDRTE